MTALTLLNLLNLLGKVILMKMRRSSSRIGIQRRFQNNVRFEAQIRERDDVDVTVDFFSGSVVVSLVRIGGGGKGGGHLVVAFTYSLLFISVSCEEVVKENISSMFDYSSFKEASSHLPARA